MRDNDWDTVQRGTAAWAVVLGHELKTPLNAILGSISLLDDEARDGGDGRLLVHRRHIERLRRNGHHLRSLMDGVMKLLGAEDPLGDRTFGLGRVSSAVEEALADVEVEASLRGVTIANCTESSVTGLSYWGHEPSVRQILVNLVANAIKFTPAGGRITITAGQQACGSQAPVSRLGRRVYVCVADTGRGIPPACLGRIFEPFQQAEADDRRRGNGLGLAISRRMASSMGGEIEVASEVGVGSVFTLHLRCDPDPIRSTETAPQPMRL